MNKYSVCNIEQSDKRSWNRFVILNLYKRILITSRCFDGININKFIYGDKEVYEYSYLKNILYLNIAHKI